MNNTTLNYLLTSTPSNIHGVGFAYKLKNGQQVDIMSVQFLVEKKVSITELNKDELLPSTVIIDGHEYQTDVIEANRIEALPCIGPRTGGTGQPFFGSYSWPVGEHRSLQRPIRGGIQLIGRNAQTNLGFGTLGGVVTDTTDGTTVGITNAHVVGLALTNTDIRPVVERGLILEDCAKMRLYAGSNLPRQEGTTNFPPIPNRFGDPGFFPGVNLCGSGLYPYVWSAPTVSNLSSVPSTYNSNLTAYSVDPDIGYIKRYSPITTNPSLFNINDVALVTFNTRTNAHLLSSSIPMLSAGYSHQQANFYHKDVCAFASTAEINSLVVDNVPLFKSGRTTYATGQPNPIGSEVRSNPVTCNLPTTAGWIPAYYFLPECTMRATSVDSSVAIRYSFGLANFQNTIMFTSSATQPAAGGDSGSLVYGLFNSNSPSTSAWKIVGLLFAGNNNATAFAIRIDNIVNTFSISAYDGGQPKYTALNNEKKIYLPGKSNVLTLTGSDNKKYWQSGLVGMVNGKTVAGPGWVPAWRSGNYP